MNVIRTPHFGFSLNWSFYIVCLSPQNTAYDSLARWQHPSSPIACSSGPGRFLFGPRGALYFSAWSHQWLDLCAHTHTSIHQASVKSFFLFAFVSCLYLATLVELSTTRISCGVLKIIPCSDGGRMLEHTVISSSGCSAIFALSGLTFPLFFSEVQRALTWLLCIQHVTAMGWPFKTSILLHRLHCNVLPGTQIWALYGNNEMKWF